MTRPERFGRCACAVLLAGVLAFASRAAAGGEPLTAAPPPAPAALQAVAALRLKFDPAAVPVEDSWQLLLFRGRESLEITGRLRDSKGPGAIRDLALFDLATGRVASFAWFPHASTRRAGEAIISLSAVSTRADAHLRALLPRNDLALESVQRLRTSGEETVYYEARYFPQRDGTPFFQAPVRLLLNASTGNLFKYDVDPDWPEPPPVPRAKLTRQAAERIAAVALSGHNLDGVFGGGATPGKVSAAELFLVRPNDWLGFFDPAASSGIRVAWVVPFAMTGAAARDGNSLFIDAGSGRVLGGVAGPAPAVPVR